MKTIRLQSLTRRYIPDLEKFNSFVDYMLAHPGGKITYKGYLVYKMKKMLSQEKKGAKE